MIDKIFPMDEPLVYGMRDRHADGLGPTIEHKQHNSIEDQRKKGTNYKHPSGVNKNSNCVKARQDGDDTNCGGCTQDGKYMPFVHIIYTSLNEKDDLCWVSCCQ